ncbi:MAG TPA: hypothetical protein VGK45_00180 [Thermoanaerobaculia bacterium]
MRTPPPFSLADILVRTSVPLAAMAALLVFARAAEPAGAAEGIYLAVLAGAALLAVAFLAPAKRPAWELGLGAVLAVTAGWALPPGPGRGAAMLLLLTALLAVAAARRLASCLPDLPLDVTLPLALGVQVLLRGNLLFHPQANVRTLVALLALPAAGAVAASLLARRHGGGPALLAAGTALLLAPGWNVLATLGLLALVAGDQLDRPDLGRIGKSSALIVLLAPIAWAPGPGLAAAVAGLALWRPRLAACLSVPVAAGLLWFTTHGHLSGPSLLAAVCLLPLLVPAAVLPESDRFWWVLAALPLVAATPQVPDVSALAAPLALAALAVRKNGPAAVAQRVWTGALLAGTALLAAYPWLRDEPLQAAIGLAGLVTGPTGGLRAAVAVLLGFAAVVMIGTMLERRLEKRSRPFSGSAVLAAAAILLALFLHLPSSGKPLLPPESGVMLDPAHPAWTADFPAPRQVESVAVETGLSGGAGLAQGTPVALVRLSDDGGRSSLWVLRAGVGTGEWAARRPDVERTALLRSPPAWISWVAGSFFGQRYRALWSLLEPGRFTHVRVELEPGLPPGVGLTVHQVEVRP